MPIFPTKMGMQSSMSGAKIVDELKKLSEPNKLPASAVQDVVMSVNGKSGNVNVTLDSLDGQKKNSTLTDISSTNWGNSVLVGTDISGHMSPINYTEYSKQILSLKSKDELINNLGLKPGEYPVTSVNGKMGSITITAEDVGAARTEHTHLIYEITGLLDELDNKLNVGETIPYSDLTGTPTIPDEQVNSDWLSTSGKSEILNKPQLFDGDYNSLENKPELFSGSYKDLADKPAIPAGQVNSDWNSESGVSQILNKPTLFSGSYTDLSNKPVIPAAQIQSDWSQSITTALDYIKNKPALFDGNYNSLTNRPTLFDGTWASLTGKPNLATVATSGSYVDLTNKPNLFSGSYSDLTNKPTIPAAQVQSDWNQTNTSALDFIKNKPAIPTVAYPVNSVNGKTGTVTLTNSDVGAAPAIHSHSISDVTGLQTALDGKISTGSSIPYNSLTGTPTIPAAQIQANWTQTSTTALDFIKNKPSLFSGAYADLTGKPSIPSNTSDLTNGAGFITSAQAPVTSVNTKTGAVSLTATDVGAALANQGTKYYRSTGTQVTGAKVKYYSVTSDANGLWTLSLGSDFTEVLDVQAQAVSTSGVTGIRQSTVNAFASNSTTITGMTWGNTVLVTILLSGTNSLSLTPNTVVRIRVEGVGV